MRHSLACTYTCSSHFNLIISFKQDDTPGFFKRADPTIPRLLEYSVPTNLVNRLYTATPPNTLAPRLPAPPGESEVDVAAMYASGPPYKKPVLVVVLLDPRFVSLSNALMFATKYPVSATPPDDALLYLQKEREPPKVTD